MSQQFLCEFIEEYKSFPCLWKVNSKEYTDRHAKSHAYDKLIEKLRTVDPEANRESVVKKINSLRTSYRKELRKVLESEKFAAGIEDLYVPRLFYFDLMNFLRDQDQEIQCSSKLNTEEIQVSDIDTEMPESPEVSLLPTPSSSSRLTQTFQKRRNKCDDMLDRINKRLALPASNNEDKFTDIGRAWTSKLRDLDPHQAIHAEKIINDVFYEAQLGNLNRNCFLQVQHERDMRHSQLPFQAMPPLQIQHSFNIEPRSNIQHSINVQKPENDPSIKTEPKEKQLPSHRDSLFFHNFDNFGKT